MRVYAEQTWGSWDRRADLDVAVDKIIQLDGRDIGLIGVDHRPDFWFIEKFYLLPAHQGQGIGGYLPDALDRRCKLRPSRASTYSPGGESRTSLL
jgi:GNAT superfamily N-acetyltransferase